MGIFILLALSVKIFSLYYTGLYKVSWTYMSLREPLSLVKSLSFASFLFGTILYFFRTSSLLAAFPMSILVIDYMLTVFFLGSFRGSKRIYLQNTGRMPLKGERVLIIGAGNTGEQIIRGMLTSQGYFPVGFLDDDLGKIGSTIHGVKVLGKREEMAKFVKEHEVESILIAMPSAPARVIRETVALGRDAGIKKIKIIPGLREIISGNITLADVKEVELENLLGREQVEIDTNAIGSYLDGKTVLVTGASGSIGSELCKQVLKFNPKVLLALDQDETGLFWLTRGSVIPIFKEQIMKGGPVEVTHPEIKRYFMVTSESVLLILQAGAMAEGGEIFVLDMGEPVKIVDLAREMIRLSGFEPDKDIPVVFTGLRRGEKLYEDLLTAEEGTDSTCHEKIFRARLNPENSGLLDDLGISLPSYLLL